MLIQVQLLWYNRSGSTFCSTFREDVGFLLERTVIEAVHEKFAHEIFNTASHRFRSTSDIQFAFAYYSFLMEETRATSVREIFSEFHTDYSQTWSDREIRTLLARTFPLPLDVALFRRDN
uniref:Stealth_CR3 domain-containing protein n=1 Tax=Glossina austeni TaxID=7395 RepID=A0A1A9V4R2_GLOAU